jgi:hypothetical protein
MSMLSFKDSRMLSESTTSDQYVIWFNTHQTTGFYGQHWRQSELRLWKAISVGR